MGDEHSLLVICGSRRNPSRTRELATTALDVCAHMEVSAELLDLRDSPMELFDGRDPTDYDDVTSDVLSTVLDAEMYLIASPVYHGGIPGALKNLIDHIPYEPFSEIPRSAGLVFTGRDKRHQFLIDTQLRGTLVYLGVHVATTSVFATEADFSDYSLTNDTVRSFIQTTINQTIALQGH